MINLLSLASINKVSPYKVKQVVDDGTFSFVTDNNVEIFVGFEQDDILRVGTIYQLSISNPKSILFIHFPSCFNSILSIPCTAINC